MATLRMLLLLWVGTGHCNDGNEYDAIILGGGMAGVSAARTLVNEGITNFLLLEGRHEVGGRMQSVDIGGVTVPAGALWAQAVGEHSNNPVYLEVLKYNLTGVFSDYGDAIYYDENGKDITAAESGQCAPLYQASKSVSAYRDVLSADITGSDISVRGALRWFGFSPLTKLQMACDYFKYDFQFNYEANLISTRYLDYTYDDFHGEEDFYIIDSRGYSSIPERILIDSVPDWQSKVHFNTVVSSILYDNNSVKIETSQGYFKAKKVIVTFSLGVLQSPSVKFSPNLPDWKLKAIHGFLYRDYLSFYLKFSDNITWFVPNEVEWIVHASHRRGYFTLWQNYNKFLPGSHILQGTVANNEAKRLQAISATDVQQEAMIVLRKLFGSEIPDPVEIVVPMRHSDPFFRGSYSAWYTEDQHTDLRAPMDPVYFAGEAYSHKYYGFTHGALLSGEETAKKVVACLSETGNCPQTDVPPYLRSGCTYNCLSRYHMLLLIVIWLWK